MSQARPHADPAALRAVLESVPLFRDLSDADLDLLAASLRTRRYRRGEVVFHQGDPGDALHIILSGRVKISSPSEAGVEARMAKAVLGIVDTAMEKGLAEGDYSALAEALATALPVPAPRL